MLANKFLFRARAVFNITKRNFGGAADHGHDDHHDDHHGHDEHHGEGDHGHDDHHHHVDKADGDHKFIANGVTKKMLVFEGLKST
jgi:ABC-type Zn2+ transport system substrate-binding protein/surface adhesin